MARIVEADRTTAISSPSTEAAATRHIPSLDGIRACSFLLVFFAHAGLNDIVPGGFGVTIFFFLSGFLITTLLRVEYEKNNRLNLRHFWLRRALRILPPFYTVLLVAVVVTLALEGADSLSVTAVGAQALHFVNYWLIDHGYGGLPPGTLVYWSLAVEEHFYLVFPWIFIWMRKSALTGRGQALLLWFICAAVLLWRCVLILKLGASESRTYMATDTRIDSILFGCALAVWRNPILDTWRPQEKTWKYVVVPICLAVLVGCLVFRDLVFRETLRYTLQGIALTPLFIAAITFKDWPPVRVLNYGPVAFVGVLSYSLYLVHYAVILGIGKYSGELPMFLRGVIAFAVSLAIAWLIYVGIERPCARLRRRLAD
jgi:peptidoglycan/LPS O-acetylase OafA/YrhL